MKTQNFKSLKVTAIILVVIISIGLLACGKGQENAKSVGSSSVNPPQIDIHTATITGNVEAVRQHIKAGTNINEKDPFGGSSPLISAAVFGQPEVARVLIESGADIDFQNNDGSTALHTAAFFCRPAIVKMLVEKGADKTIKNAYGATPYESIVAPFDQVKSAYDMMGTMLEPMGLKLDYEYIKKTRPVIAEMLK